MKITDFCRMHNACTPGIEWALANGLTDMRELWERDDLPAEYRVWIATREGVMSDRDSRLFACWCVRQVWKLLNDERSKRAIEVAEKFANGEATKEELDAAWAAAMAAAGAAVWDAAWAAARAAARDDAGATVWDAACAAAGAAVWAAARAAQSSYLRKIIVNL